MSLLLSILIDGLIYASWLFIVAAGLTLVYGTMRILNMAHGSFYAIGAYSCTTMMAWYYANGYAPWASFFVLAAAAIVAGLIAGLITERGVLRFMYGRDEVVMVLVTYAVLLIFEDLIMMIWGGEAHYAFQPYRLLGRTKIAGINFMNYDLSLIGVAAIVGLLLWYGLNHTRHGKMLRVVIHDREVGFAMGINVPRLFAVTFAIGAGLGAFAGGISAPAIAVNPGLGVEVIVLAFAVVVTGGLGSIQGALVGALLIGLARATAVSFFPEAELFVIYSVMAGVLAFRPHGLFPLPAVRRI